MESTEEAENEEQVVSELRSELWEKERKLTDIRLEALSSAHQLEQLRDAMNNMQVCVCVSFRSNTCLYIYRYVAVSALVCLMNLNLDVSLTLFVSCGLVNGGKLEGRERPFEDRKCPQPLWLRSYFLHLPALWTGLSAGTLTKAANEHVPRQVLQPQPE